MAPNTDEHLIRVTAVSHILAVPERAVIALGEQGGERYVTTSSLRTYIKRKNRRARRAAPKSRANHEGSVYDSPRGSGIWYAAISVREGRKRRRVKRRASSQQEALQKLEEIRRTYREGRTLQPAPAEPAEGAAEEPAALPTYAELFEEWRAAIETSVKRSTLRHYDTAISQWLRPHLGERQISVSDFRFLQQLFNEQLSPRYAPSTVHRAYSTLRQALDYAVEPARYIASNPAARLRLPKLKTLSPSIALSIDELVAVLRLARGHRYGAVIFFAALTSARLGECLGIQQGDVDPQRNTIYIQRQLTTLRGEGVVEETLKTAGSDRLLPRTPRLATLLERTVAERRVALQYLGHHEAPGGWFFLNTEGGLLSPRLVKRAFDELVERAGLAEIYPAKERPGREQGEGGEGKQSGGRRKRCEVSFHDLRSTLLTQLGDLGVDETTRGRIAGHGPKNVTQRYDRSTAERMRAALTAFEELVFAALEKGEEGR